jgi:predicted DNA-binding transcriptional regulator YafY
MKLSEALKRDRGRTPGGRYRDVQNEFGKLNRISVTRGNTQYQVDIHFGDKKLTPTRKEAEALAKAIQEFLKSGV